MWSLWTTRLFIINQLISWQFYNDIEKMHASVSWKVVISFPSSGTIFAMKVGKNGKSYSRINRSKKFLILQTHLLPCKLPYMISWSMVNPLVMCPKICNFPSFNYLNNFLLYLKIPVYAHISNASNYFSSFERSCDNTVEKVSDVIIFS